MFHISTASNNKLAIDMQDICMGIKTSTPYTIQLQIKNVNYFMLLGKINIEPCIKPRHKITYLY